MSMRVIFELCESRVAMSGSSSAGVCDGKASAGEQAVVEVATEAQRSSEAGEFQEKRISEGMSKKQWKKLLKRQKIEQGRAEWRYAVTTYFLHSVRVWLSLD